MRDFYLAYLNSAAWRQRRNRKLRQVGWQCERCPAKRHLEVHHRTYERLGKEFDSDLEALCESCHNAEHIAQANDSAEGVYLKFARHALRVNPFHTIGELAEDTKRLCAQHHVAYEGYHVDRAIALLTATRIMRTPSREHAEALKPFNDRPIAHAEALSLLNRLYQQPLSEVIRTIPSGPTEAEQLEHEQRVLAQAQLFRNVRPRRSVTLEQLAEIFSE